MSARSAANFSAVQRMRPPSYVLGGRLYLYCTSSSKIRVGEPDGLAGESDYRSG